MIIKGREFTDQQAASMEKIIDDGDSGRYTSHCSYSEFVNKCRQKGMGDKADELWTRLLDGFHIQKQKHEEASRKIKALLDANPTALELPEGTYETFLREITDNEFLVQVVELIKDNLKVPAGKQMALWTGGEQISRLLHRRELENQLCILDGTEFGDILNTVPMTVSWIREEGLWNLISKKFVQQYEGEWVHIYFRNVSEVTILFAQELVELKKKKVKVAWHPLVTLPNGELREVVNVPASTAYADVNKIHLRFVGETQSDSFEKAMNEAFEAWENKVNVSSPIANSRALKGYYYHNYAFFRPPYAINLNLDDKSNLINFYVAMSAFR